jgi:serine O-acetyltransferase
MSLLKSDLIAFLDTQRVANERGIVRLVRAGLRIASNPGTLSVGLFRAAASLQRAGLGPLAAVITMLNVYITGADVDPHAQIGPGFVIQHPVGVVIHADVRIGERCRIHSGVVLGLRGPRHAGAPTMGDDVFVGAGAKVLGPVAVGDRVAIGANSVVLQDVPDDCRAVGVPARNVASPED